MTNKIENQFPIVTVAPVDDILCSVVDVCKNCRHAQGVDFDRVRDDDICDFCKLTITTFKPSGWEPK